MDVANQEPDEWKETTNASNIRRLLRFVGHLFSRPYVVSDFGANPRRSVFSVTLIGTTNCIR